MNVTQEFTFTKFWEDEGDFTLFLIPTIRYEREKSSFAVWHNLEANFLNMTGRIEVERKLSPKTP